MRALIVEPSRFVGSVLSALFAKNNVDPRVATSAREATTALEAQRFDLVCFAHELPEMRGLEWYERCKQAGLIGDTPVVMISATDDSSVLHRALQAGVTECFDKRYPEDIEQFIETFALSSAGQISGYVLLAEDNMTAAHFCISVLKAIGLNVDHFDTAEAAIDALHAREYDLVVTDYVLAGRRTGLSVVRAVRTAGGKKAHLPILAMSALDDTARKIEIIRNGANDFVAKPILAEELEVRVRNLLTMRQLLRQLETQHQMMKEMASRDRLTSLHNRHYVDEILPRLLDQAKKEDKSLSIIVLDVDHFKAINDSHGHPGGDAVLVAISDLLRAVARPHDVTARFGGEEFLLLLPNTELINAAIFAENLRLRIETLAPNGIRVTASLGVATWAPPETFDELFKRADDAVYCAKRDGRNQVVAASA